MTASPDDDGLRLAFHERLADAELYLLLAREAKGEALDPRLFETSQGRFVLVFDLPERLAAFADGEAPYAVLSGRVLVSMLVGQGIGIALNPDVAPSSHLVASDAVSWLAGALSEGPAEMEARASTLAPPAGVPERLLRALDAKLAAAKGLARMAYLAGVTYEGGAQSHILAFIDATPGAERSLAKAVREALVFSGLEAGALDVAFFRASDPVSARLARVGLRFDLPRFEAPESVAPGSDPDKPPRLK